MLDPADMRVDQFSPLIGDPIQILPGGDAAPIPARLLEAEAYANPPRRPAHLPPREPFALLFSIPDQAVLPQGLYRLHHARLGEMRLFLVPVGPGLREAVLN